MISDQKNACIMYALRTFLHVHCTLMGTTMDTGWRKKMPPCQKLPPSFMNFRSDPLTRAKKKKLIGAQHKARKRNV